MLVSIIVPVYNAEATITRCVQSIQAQVYTNIEIIIVDDGSTDGSAAILDALAKEDGRIRVVHTQNKGVSSARNTGLSLAAGDYIGFVDADDWIDADMYQHLVGMITKDAADIAICGHYLEYEDAGAEPQTERTVFPVRRVLSNKEAFGAALKTYGYQGFLFNKLFRAAFFAQEGYGIRMDETLHICEDLLCVCGCLVRAGRITYDPVPLYHYLIADNSASHGSFSLRKATLIDASRKIAELTQQSFPPLSREAYTLYMTNVAFIVTVSLHAKSGYKLPRAHVRWVRKHLFSYIFGKGNAKKYKWLLIGLAISQRAVGVVWNQLRRKPSNG